MWYFLFLWLNQNLNGYFQDINDEFLYDLVSIDELMHKGVCPTEKLFLVLLGD